METLSRNNHEELDLYHQYNEQQAQSLDLGENLAPFGNRRSKYLTPGKSRNPTKINADLLL